LRKGVDEIVESDYEYEIVRIPLYQLYLY